MLPWTQGECVLENEATALLPWLQAEVTYYLNILVMRWPWEEWVFENAASALLPWHCYQVEMYYLNISVRWCLNILVIFYLNILVMYHLNILVTYYSLLHLECHFFTLKSKSMIEFSTPLWPRSLAQRPRRLRLEIEIRWHSKCNRLYLNIIFYLNILVIIGGLKILVTVNWTYW